MQSFHICQFYAAYLLNYQLVYQPVLYIQQAKNGTTEYVFSYDQANDINNTYDIVNYLDSIAKLNIIQDSINVVLIDNKKKTITNM